jgi:hypothetical protein
MRPDHSRLEAAAATAGDAGAAVTAGALTRVVVRRTRPSSRLTNIASGSHPTSPEPITGATRWADGRDTHAIATDHVRNAFFGALQASH